MRKPIASFYLKYNLLPIFSLIAGILGWLFFVSQNGEIEEALKWTAIFCIVCFFVFKNSKVTESSPVRKYTKLLGKPLLAVLLVLIILGNMLFVTNSVSETNNLVLNIFINIATFLAAMN